MSRLNSKEIEEALEDSMSASQSFEEYVAAEDTKQRLEAEKDAERVRAVNDRAHEWRQQVSPKVPLSNAQLAALRTAAQKFGKPLTDKQREEILRLSA